MGMVWVDGGIVDKDWEDVCGMDNLGAELSSRDVEIGELGCVEVGGM